VALFEQLLAAVDPSHSANPWTRNRVRARNGLMLKLFYELGVRRGELLALCLEDFNARESRLSIVRRPDNPKDPRRRQPVVKTEERVLQLSPEAAAEHFTPSYKPWDQRVCVVPDGDLFKAIRLGRASVVTDRIARFTRGGILLQSGRELAADLVVMATGLTLKLFGGATLVVDGRVLDPSRAMSYKGMMLSGVPNCALAFGYTNASWTLKADLTAAWVCRLLRHMDARGQAIAVAQRDPEVPEVPFLDFNSGYVERARHLLPKQGARKPWQVYQNYLRDLLTIRFGRIDDGVLRFGQPGAMP